jgi:aspartate/methionine/tyrosine aminotransferase
MSEKTDYADRMDSIQPFHVMDLLARARQLEAEGRDIVHMEIGEPDFPTPDPVRRAALRVLESDPVHYTPALGLPQLREAISGFYQQRYGLDIPASRIVVTPGASGALLLVVNLLINPGDGVLMSDPGYPCNRNFVRLACGKSVMIPVNADTQYQVTENLVRQHWNNNSRAVLLASPANPTGSLVDHEELKKIHTYVQHNQGHLIVDEIYHGLVYSDHPESALSIDDSVFVINSFSKYFGMTGWRLGWIVAPEWAVEGLDRLAQNLYLAAPTLAQHAALRAFSPENLEILEQRRQTFAQRRDFLVPALRSLGFELPFEPEGAFYVYANCEKFSNDSFALCNALLSEAGVAVTPGLDFGEHLASKHLRFAYTADIERLEEGVRRLQHYLSA